MQTRYLSFSSLLCVGLLAGCASTATAPMRDSSGTQPPAAVIPAEPGFHYVRPGDTLLGIARQYGVTLPELVRWNTLVNPDQIQVGQAIRIAAPGTEQGSFATGPMSPDGGAVAMPVPVPGAAHAPSVPTKTAPIGGAEPYSDAALAKAAPATELPAATLPAPPSDGAGQWQWPAGGQLIAGYNEATNKGVDIGGAVGDPVFAAADGKVVYAGSGLRGYGKLIVIKHNQEYNSVYAHNDKLLVKEEDQVRQGQKIAELGNSEADRPKLHFEIRRQGKAIDPMRYLPAR